ncbi:50S ribosomal protein L30 [Candidatus Neomarinimicrobiota bacterium]
MSKTKNEKVIRITQTKSRIGYTKKAKQTLDALGLRKMHQSVEKKDTPAIRGMVKKIYYLLKVEELE